MAVAEKTVAENASTLEQNRDLILRFKAELQKQVDVVAKKDEEITTLRGKVDQAQTELALKDSQIVEHEDDISTLNAELQSKTDEVSRALS